MRRSLIYPFAETVVWPKMQIYAIWGWKEVRFKPAGPASARWLSDTAAKRNSLTSMPRLLVQTPKCGNHGSNWAFHA